MTIIGTPISSAARLGMVDLITRWRRMVADAAGAVWDDLEAQELLDTLRTEHTGLALTPQWRLEAGVYVTRLYLVGMGNLESSASGAEAWRLYDNAGAAVSGANTNYLLGSVTFDADQAARRGSSALLMALSATLKSRSPRSVSRSGQRRSITCSL